MPDTTKHLFERLKVLYAEQTRVRDFLFRNNDGLKPARDESARRKWYAYEMGYCYMPWEERTQDVEAKRGRLRKALEEDNEAYRVACLGGDAGAAYQIVLDEIKQIDAEIIRIGRLR